MKTFIAVVSAAVALVAAQTEYVIFCYGNTGPGEIPNCKSSVPPGNYLCPDSNTFCLNEETCGFGNLLCVPAGQIQCPEDPSGLITCPSGNKCAVNGDGSIGCVSSDAPAGNFYCSDGIHYCPNGSTCGIENFCVQDGQYQCPAPNASHMCPTGSTCDPNNPGNCISVVTDHDTPTNKRFLIQHRKSKDYITQAEFRYDHGNSYTLWSFHSKSFQSFIFTANGGLESTHGRVCMQNGNPNGVEAGIAKMWPCVSPASDIQNFYYETTNSWIMAKATGLCLTASRKGKYVYVKPCDPSNTNQVFDLIF